MSGDKCGFVTNKPAPVTSGANLSGHWWHRARLSQSLSTTEAVTKWRPNVPSRTRLVAAVLHLQAKLAAFQSEPQLMLRVKGQVWTGPAFYHQIPSSWGRKRE